MKKKILTICLVLVFLLAAPIALLVTGFATPRMFGETYYGELSEMYERLKTSEGKRIIAVGGSSIAFGLRGDLMEQEFEGYTVCPFGLYGSIGTKFMMDLSERELREGDIVLLLPEQMNQSLSLYFGAEHIWRAADGAFGLLAGVKREDVGSMVGAYPAFVGRKYDYLCHGAPEPADIYRADSFDDTCTLVYDRPQNLMENGVDSFSVSYRTEVADPAFLDYVNAYVRSAEARGASVLFGFCPVNLSGVEAGTDGERLENYRAFLQERLDCEVMGTPQDYLFEKEWFYDSNVHCNSAGAIVYTRRLVKDLKGCLGDPSPVQIALPEKPQMPEEAPPEEEGDNSCASAFLYEENGEGVRIVGMSEEGKTLERIVVPMRYEGKRVTGFDAAAFRDQKTVREIVLQQNIRSIPDGSFSGCTALERVYLPKGVPPNRCTVAFSLIEGAAEVRFYVEKQLLSAYANDYFWSRYASLLVAY